MPELHTGCVDLTVTSPPYWNAIDYDVHCADNRQNYRPRQDMVYEDYLAFLERCFSEVFRVHREGTICAVVIGTVLLNGRHTPLPFHFVGLMERVGWQFAQDIVWSKCTGGVKRAGSTIQHPYPGYFYPNIMTEYILLFRKPGARRIYDGRTKEEREQNRVRLDSVFTKEVANNIWHIAPVPPGQCDHPCPFPEEIPYRLVRWFSYQNDLILDPFCGIGTTLKVADNLKRRWVGYEIIQKYADIAMKRVRETLILRKQLVVGLEKLEYGKSTPAKNRPRAPFRRKASPQRENIVIAPDLLLFSPGGK
ncbi:site-specific DNA-methyltransferase [Candidatus Sumerlaeota bacterium]|nr:site-specific DNA-methyltransferase [Candidatus Sumerlaeota bacterium]